MSECFLPADPHISLQKTTVPIPSPGVEERIAAGGEKYRPNGLAGWPKADIKQHAFFGKRSPDHDAGTPKTTEQKMPEAALSRATASFKEETVDPANRPAPPPARFRVAAFHIGTARLAFH